MKIRIYIKLGGKEIHYAKWSLISTIQRNVLLHYAKWVKPLMCLTRTTGTSKIHEKEKMISDAMSLSYHDVMEVYKRPMSVRYIPNIFASLIVLLISFIAAPANANHLTSDVCSSSTMGR